MAVTFTQKAADRISRAVKWVEQQIRTQGPSEGTVTPRSVEPTYVLTTSGTATSGFYPGKVVLYSAADAAWQEYTTCKILPANGETLTNNTRYAARYTGRDSGGDGVFAVLQGTAGSLTVEEQDGSPSYTGVTKLQFDQADGFSLSNPATGTTRVDILAATQSQTGVVTSAAQAFAGVKNFKNDVRIGGKIRLTDIPYVDGTPGGPDYGDSLVIEWDSNISRLFFKKYTDIAGFANYLITTTYTTYSMSDGLWYIGIHADRSNTGNTCFYIGESPTSNGAAGQWGTLKTNATVRGGIITNLGNTSTQSSSWMGF